MESLVGVGGTPSPWDWWTKWQTQASWGGGPYKPWMPKGTNSLLMIIRPPTPNERGAFWETRRGTLYYMESVGVHLFIDSLIPLTSSHPFSGHSVDPFPSHTHMAPPILLLSLHLHYLQKRIQTRSCVAKTNAPHSPISHPYPTPKIRYTPNILKWYYFHSTIGFDFSTSTCCF